MNELKENFGTLEEIQIPSNCKGKGSFGKVYKCTHKTLNRVFALKIIETFEEENYNFAVEEATLLANIKKHRNLLYNDFVYGFKIQGAEED